MTQTPGDTGTDTALTVEQDGHKSLMELRALWDGLSAEIKKEAFCKLERASADDFFQTLSVHDQAELLTELPEGEKRIWIKVLAPDDLTDVLQEVSLAQRKDLLGLLDGPTRKEVHALLAYKEDEAGGLMNPRFARVRPDMKVEEALKYLRRQTQNLETMRYIYVLDHSQELLGIVSLRTLFLASGDKNLKEIMRQQVITATDTMSQEEIKNLFQTSGLNAIPILNKEHQMCGIVTVDDIVDVVEEEATRDIQKLGGSEVLDEPYLKISIFRLIGKRAGWLTALFLGEMFTATAMGYYEKEIARAVVLALFIPLIISSGGNSGSQASTLVVRAMALNEVRLKDWWRVLLRELVVGTVLGIILGSIGLIRILLWPSRETLYGPHFALVGLTVACSLIGIVLWGSLSGSLLPFILRKVGFDPATASAPFVATLVDVSGLIIYFTMASMILQGTLL